MTIEGNDGSFGGVVIPAHETAHGWVLAAVCAAGFVAALAASNQYEDTGTALPTVIVGEYLDLNACLEETLASGGLSAICTARDGSTWRILQTEAQVIVPKSAVSDSLYKAIQTDRKPDEQHASLLFNKPLVVVPETTQNCTLSCTIAAKDAEGDWAFYPPTTTHVIGGINQALSITGLRPSQARLVVPGLQD